MQIAFDELCCKLVEIFYPLSAFCLLYIVMCWGMWGNIKDYCLDTKEIKEIILCGREGAGGYYNYAMGKTHIMIKCYFVHDNDHSTFFHASSSLGNRKLSWSWRKIAEHKKVCESFLGWFWFE